MPLLQKVSLPSFRFLLSRASSFVICLSRKLQYNRTMKLELELDRERATLLLVINTQLIKKALLVYKGMFLNQKALAQMLTHDRQQLMDLYQHYTRRIHCNLGVLLYIHEKYQGDPTNSRMKFPIILNAPPDMPELTPAYNKLQEAYPEAVHYLKMKISQMKQQQQKVPGVGSAPVLAPVPGGGPVGQGFNQQFVGNQGNQGFDLF